MVYCGGTCSIGPSIPWTSGVVRAVSKSIHKPEVIPKHDYKMDKCYVEDHAEYMVSRSTLTISRYDSRADSVPPRQCSNRNDDKSLSYSDSELLS